MCVCVLLFEDGVWIASSFVVDGEAITWQRNKGVDFHLSIFPFVPAEKMFWGVGKPSKILLRGRSGDLKRKVEWTPIVSSSSLAGFRHITIFTKYCQHV